MFATEFFAALMFAADYWFSVIVTPPPGVVPFQPIWLVFLGMVRIPPAKDLGVLMTVEVVAALAARKTAVFDGCKLCLIKYKLPIRPDSSLTTLAAAKATFSGYADKTIVAWDAADVDDQDTAFLSAPAQTFIHNGGAIANVINAWYVTNAAGNALLGGGVFATPVDMSAGAPDLVMTPRFEIPPQIED